jgi:hypothetical protein
VEDVHDAKIAGNDDGDELKLVLGPEDDACAGEYHLELCNRGNVLALC